MIEPDEDEDPTRLCAKCEQRPRWSKHGACRNCAVCAGSRGLSFCLRRRKSDEPSRKVQLPKHAQLRLDRYHALRALGATSAEAVLGAGSVASFEMAKFLHHGGEPSDMRRRPPTKKKQTA